MAAAAIVVLSLTITVGVVVLGFWSAPTGQHGDPRSRAVFATHLAGAVLAATVSVAYFVSRGATIGATAIGAVVATIALGASTFASSRRSRPVPAALLVIHGVLAASTLTLIVAAVAQG